MDEEEVEGCGPCKKIKLSHEISNGGLKGTPEAGNYWLGPIIKKKRPHVTQCIARRKGTDDCYLMKILVLNDRDIASRCSFVTRTDFHNEYSILTLLKNNPGVIQLCDFFKDYEYEEEKKKDELKRVCMVLECLIQHSYHNAELVPLNHYLKKNKLSEIEALYIFYNLLAVLESLHNKNIVHKDLNLSNIILNRKTLKVKLIDFYYAELLTSDNENQYQYRNLSCSSPDVTFGQPISSKTCDLCSAGVVLYAMLNGCLPFPNGATYGSLLLSSRSLRVLYLKFMENDCISDGTKELLRDILWMPQRKLKARDVMDVVSNLLAIHSTSQNPSAFTEKESSDQVVPECPNFDYGCDQEGSSASSKKSSSVSEISLEAETNEKNVKQRQQKILKTADDSEGAPPSPVIVTKPTQPNALLNRKEIKYAMLRLGATSINSINALSFNYNKKNLRRS